MNLKSIPLGVKLISALIILKGVLYIVSIAIIVSVSYLSPENIKTLSHFTTSKKLLMTTEPIPSSIVVLGIIIGLAFIGVGIGLLKGDNKIRQGVIALLAISIIFAIFGLLAGGASVVHKYGIGYLIPSIIFFVINVVMMRYLQGNSRVKEFFRVAENTLEAEKADS